MMIRFTIQLDDQGFRSIRCDRDGWELPQRNVSAQPMEHWSGDAAAVAAWHDVAEMARLAAVKLSANPLGVDGRAQTPRIAAYLFEALIGRENWTAMTGHADALAPDRRGDMELALQFKSSSSSAPGVGVDFGTRSHALPWELLCAAVPADGRLVTVTRLVESSAPPPAPLSWPPRVLFVLSGTLADLELRPATEAMGLLSVLEARGPEEPLTTALRFVPQSLIIERATYTSLKEAVRAFRPELVHFICHGRPGELVLQADPQRDNRQSLKAVELLDCLSSGTRPPTVVILAACESGVMAGSQGTGSLAEQLAAGGISVVVGMAGRISSVACRLFTRALAESLFRDTSRTLVESIGLARSAALKLHRGTGGDTQPAEWALPTAYLAHRVPETYCAIDEARVRRQRRWEGWVRTLNLADRPLLCCREALLASYRRAVRPDSTFSVVLAMAPGPDHGKTRALKEVGMWALQDGQIPLPVLAVGGDWDAPTTPRALGLQLINAMEMVRTAFGLPEPIFGQLIELLAPPAATSGPLPTNPRMRLSRHCADIRKLEEQASAQPDPLQVREAFCLDAQLLCRLIVEAHPDDFRADRTRVLVLLDDGQKYRPMLRQILLPPGRPATRGFGDGTMTIPVFVALDWDENAKMELDTLASQVWVDKLELKPFPPDEHGDLAYERVLLHPFDERISPKPLCFALTDDRGLFSGIRQGLRDSVKGIPGRLFADGMKAVVNVARSFNVLVEAKDSGDLLRDFVRERGAP